MSCFGDINKLYNVIDNSLNNTSKNRYCSCPNESVLISESKHLIALYDRTLSPIRSWSFPQSKSLTLPAVYDYKKDYMVTVQNGNILTKWSIHQDKHKLSQTPLDSNISALVFVKKVGVVIVLDTGRCQIFDQRLGNTSYVGEKNIILDKEEIVNVCANFRHSILHVYLFTKLKNENSSTYNSLYYIKLSHSGNVIEDICQPFKNCFDFWTLNPNQDCMVVLRQNKDKFSICSYNTKINKELFTLESTLIKNLYGICLNDDSQYICIIGDCETDNFICELWNMKYGFKLGHINLPYEPLKNDCNILNNTIFISSAKGIISIPLIIKKNLSLANLIGKGKTTFDLSPPFSQLEEICHSLDSSDISNENLNQQFFALVNQIAQTNLYVPEKTIVKVFITCLKQLRKDNLNEKFIFMLEMIFKLPYNEDSLITILKSYHIDFENISLALEVLLSFLPTSNCKIIDWMCVLLDAFINQFLVNQHQQLKDLIIDLENKVNHYIKYYENIDNLKNIIDCLILNEKFHDETKSMIGEYSIEYLHF